jgi:hypothetical protein
MKKTKKGNRKKRKEKKKKVKKNQNKKKTRWILALGVFYGRTAALRLLVQPCGEDDDYYHYFCPFPSNAPVE